MRSQLAELFTVVGMQPREHGLPEDVPDSCAVFRVHFQGMLQEVEVRTAVRDLLEVNFFDLPQELEDQLWRVQIASLTMPRRSAHNNLEAENASRPNVILRVIPARTGPPHLRRHVRWCACYRHRFAVVLVIIQENGHAEVAQVTVPKPIHKDVVTLHVTMDDASDVQPAECREHIVHDDDCKELLEGSPAGDQALQRSTIDELHHDAQDARCTTLR
mmetsp:Transcript_127470/g.318294  ORF Transcript_127470/g.318294 Transcript_127470/m.318294 type:complete len:217 (-) Transcript_127470:408-1058(-)